MSKLMSVMWNRYPDHMRRKIERRDALVRLIRDSGYGRLLTVPAPSPVDLLSETVQVTACGHTRRWLTLKGLEKLAASLKLKLKEKHMLTKPKKMTRAMRVELALQSVEKARNDLSSVAAALYLMENDRAYHVVNKAIAVDLLSADDHLLELKKSFPIKPKKWKRNK